mgnify:CR=1 FL=1
MGEKIYATEPAAAGALEEYGNHIVQYSPEYSLCTGCETCSILCGLSHEGFTGPGNSRIRIDLGTRSMIHRVLACQQCSDHPCYDACPKKGAAMKIDDNGIVYIDEVSCIGCGLCARHCKFQPSRIAMKRDKVRKQWKAVKCDLCRDNPEGPQCIKWCPVRCIGLVLRGIFLSGIPWTQCRYGRITYFSAFLNCPMVSFATMIPPGHASVHLRRRGKFQF